MRVPKGRAFSLKYKVNPSRGTRPRDGFYCICSPDISRGNSAESCGSFLRFGHRRAAGDARHALFGWTLLASLGIASPLGAEPRACARWDTWVRLSRAWVALAAEPHRVGGSAVPGYFLPLNNIVLAPAKTLDAPCVHQEGVLRINASGNVRCKIMPPYPLPHPLWRLELRSLRRLRWTAGRGLGFGRSGWSGSRWSRRR